ncbi:MAG TPA: TorF family putative porin, partial [Reyranella sp.]|nr:TorF family putative porin [Reyranella sp.]
MSKAAAWTMFLAVAGMAADVRAQDRWMAPFGGTWSATVAVLSDYSFRGISLTDRQPAVQAGLGYDLPLVPDRFHLYLEAWGANVSFSPDFSTELTASASAIFYGFDRRLAVELSFSRYSYLEAPPELGANYNEF